jgi:replicative DNA helicase
MKQDVEHFRHVPYDIEVEQAVLGALLLDNRRIDVVAADLDPFHFYDPLHQRLFEMVVHLSTEGAVTPLIVNSVMKADAGYIEVGGLAYLAGLAQACPTMPNLSEYARILKEIAARRALIRIGENVVNDAYDAPHERPALKIAAAATEELLRLGETQRKSVISLGDAAQGSVTRIEQRMNGVGEKGITTGLRRMDKAMGGMLPGDRIGIAGRTGMGKSLFASSISTAAALAGAPVMIVSADMRVQQWADRVICDVDRYRNPGEKPLHYQKFRTGQITDREWERLVLAQQEIATLPIDIDDNPKASIATIRGRARVAAQKYPKQQGILLVDFLQKIEVADTGYRERRRDEDLTKIAYDLGDVVRDIGWTLLVLIQILNKETDGKGQLREDPPNVASIRESGGIEQALDIIVSPFRKAFFIERREPPGRGYAEGVPPDWLAWRAEYSEWKNRMQLLGWKNRDGSSSALNLDLWCDPGSASVRDEEPKVKTEADKAADELRFDYDQSMRT